MEIKTTLNLLNHYLCEKDEARSFIICGGAALILQNIIGRATIDIDVISPKIDEILNEASVKVSQQLGISAEWLNSAPEGLMRDMRPGWENRVLKIYEASHLSIFSISREDMIFTKFYAYCDRQKDLFDLLELKPSVEELELAAERTRQIDGHIDWPQYVEVQKIKLKKKLGYE